jgi:hypothetical protein
MVHRSAILRACNNPSAHPSAFPVTTPSRPAASKRRPSWASAHRNRQSGNEHPMITPHRAADEALDVLTEAAQWSRISATVLKEKTQETRELFEGYEDEAENILTLAQAEKLAAGLETLAVNIAGAMLALTKALSETPQ